MGIEDKRVVGVNPDETTKPLESEVSTIDKIIKALKIGDKWTPAQLLAFRTYYSPLVARAEAAIQHWNTANAWDVTRSMKNNPDDEEEDPIEKARLGLIKARVTTQTSDRISDRFVGKLIEVKKTPSPPSYKHIDIRGASTETERNQQNGNKLLASDHPPLRKTKK